MKKILLLLLCPITFFSQNLFINDTIRFLALGDSYTIGQSVSVNERWPVQLSDSLVNRGKVFDTLRIIATTGWRTDNLLAAITNQQLQKQHYNLVSLLIGVNNQYQGKPFSQYITEFPALLDSAILYAGGNKNRVFVVSIPDYAYTPYGQSTSNQAQISSQLAQYNQYAKHVADSLQIRFFNITPISQQGIQNPALVAGDGLHPSGLQYSKWVKLMLDSIDAHLTTGVQLNEKPDLVRVSPNPCSDVIKITHPFMEESYRVSVYDVTGQEVLKQTISGNPGELIFTELPKGLYILKIFSKNNYYVRKLLKI